MTDTFEPKFGWLSPPTEKTLLHQSQYSWHQVVPETVLVVNIVNDIPVQFISWYNQGNKNACVGASSAQAMAWMNLRQLGLKSYDWWQMYCKICEIDNSPQTSCQNDIGTYTYASGDCLRKFGPYETNKGWQLDQGIEQYYWARKDSNGVDDVRTAISFSTQENNSQICCIGMPWYQEFMADSLKKDNKGNWWFPERKKWSRTVGGHQIGVYDAVDSMGAFGFVNTWGNNWPKKVYMRYEDFAYLLGIGSECAIFVDKTFEPPEPPPTPEPRETITLTKILVQDETGMYNGENIILPRVK
jgi:hypothetical protein